MPKPKQINYSRLSINGEVYSKPADTHLTTMQEKATLALFEYVMETKSGTKPFKKIDFEYDPVNKINKKTGVQANPHNIKKWLPGNNAPTSQTTGNKKVVTIKGAQTPFKKHTLTVAQQIVFKHMPAKHHKDIVWLVNFFKQQDKFFNETINAKKITGSKNKWAHYDRDTAKGFMEEITAMVAKKPFSFSKKDTWNPADIWLVKDKKKALTKLKAVIDKGSKLDRDTQLLLLNNSLRAEMAMHRIVGVSLKKVSGEAKFEVVNLTEDFNFIPDKGPNVYNYKEGTPKSICDLRIVVSDYLPSDPNDGKDKDWKNQLGKFAKSTAWQTAIKAVLYPTVKHWAKDDDRLKPASWKNMAANMLITEDGNDWFLLPIKSNATSDNRPQNLKFEPVPENAPGSRAGKADVGEVRKLFTSLSGTGAYAFSNQATEYPDNLDDWNSVSSKYVSKVNSIKSFIKTGGVDGNKFAENVTRLFTEVAVMDGTVGKLKLKPAQKKMLQSEKEKEKKGEKIIEIKQSADRLRYNIVSKLMQVHCLWVLKYLSSKTYTKDITALDVWVTYVCFMAQKKGAGFGPFGKIY